MAGVIMAAEVTSNSFLNNEGLKENSSSKDGQRHENEELNNSDVTRMNLEGEQSKENEQSDTGLDEKGKSGLFLNDAEVTRKIHPEGPVLQSSEATAEFRKRNEDGSSVSHTDEGESGGSISLQSGSNVEQREQWVLVNEKEPKENETANAETDFLEDMRIFEAETASCGQAKGPMEWILRQIGQDTDPRVIIAQLMPGTIVPNHIDDITLWKGVWELITEPKARRKLDNVNTMEDVVNLIKQSKKIIVLTGAGVSVSCGIPDFRSRDGIYARLSKDFPDLPDPQSMFDIHYFRRDQRPFFKFAREIYPGQFRPSLSHRFIAALDKKDKLLRNYTQNIDTLEQVAGIQRVVQCHGSFATASCTNCKYKVNAEFIREDIFNQVVPKCPICPQDGQTLAVMKPDIIFFGEGLPDAFYHNLDTDKHEADLLVVIGSSLKVRPVALIPDYLKPDVPQILINREPLHHFNFDVELLGNCDAIIHELCRRLGTEWIDVPQDYQMPPLDKEAIEKLFQSSSESESEASTDEMEVAGKLASSVESKIDQSDKKGTSNLNSEIISNDSVPINLGQISCQNYEEKHEIVLENKNEDMNKSSGVEFLKSSETPVNSSATAQDSSAKQICDKVEELHPSSPDSDLIDSKPHDAIESQSHDAVESQSHDAVESQPMGTKSHDSFNSKSHDAIGWQSHNAIGRQSHDAIENQSMETLSHDAIDSKFDDAVSNQASSDVSTTSHDACVPHSAERGQSNAAAENSAHDSLHLQSQDAVFELSGNGTNNTKSAERKRIIDEVYKKCSDCEKKKVHERSDFSSEARLAQNSTTHCKCREENKRRKLDSSSGSTSKDVEKSEKSQKTPSSSSIDSHKERCSSESSKQNAPDERELDFNIRAHSPSFDKKSVLERLRHQEIFYLFVPPNRHIFHGAELSTHIKFRRGSDSSGSENEDENATKKPWETDAEQSVN